MTIPRNSKLIPLSQGKFAIVDASDYDWINQWKWSCTSHGYVVRGRNIIVDNEKKYRLIYMHQEIMQTPAGMDTDHINGNGLDNRRCNLRICTREQNTGNQKPLRGITSKFKGVHWVKTRNKWRVSVAGKFVGEFDSEIEAAGAYNESAIKHFGEFARLNEVMP